MANKKRSLPKKACLTQGSSKQKENRPNIAMSKQLQKKKMKQKRTRPKIQNKIKARCPKKKPMPSLADLEKMFEDSDDDSELETIETHTQATPSAAELTLFTDTIMDTTVIDDEVEIVSHTQLNDIPNVGTRSAHEIQYDDDDDDCIIVENITEAMDHISTVNLQSSNTETKIERKDVISPDIIAINNTDITTQDEDEVIDVDALIAQNQTILNKYQNSDTNNLNTSNLVVDVDPNVKLEHSERTSSVPITVNNNITNLHNPIHTYPSNTGRETASSIPGNTASIINRGSVKTSRNTNPKVRGSRNPINTYPSNAGRETASSDNAIDIISSESHTISNTQRQRNDDVIDITTTSREIHGNVRTSENTNRKVRGPRNPINSNPSNTRRETASIGTSNTANNINSSGPNTTLNIQNQSNDDVMITATTSRELQSDIGTLGNANRAVSRSQNPINTNPSNTRRETASIVTDNTANNINSSGSNTTSNTQNQSNDDTMITATTSTEIQRDIGTLGNANRAVSRSQNPNNTYPSNAGRETALSVTGNNASNINSSGSNTTSNTQNQRDDDVMITATTPREIQRTIGTLGNANRAVSGSQNPNNTYPSNAGRETASSVTSNSASIINRSGSNTTSNTRSQGNDDVIIIASTSREIQTDIGTLGNANRAVSGSQNPNNTYPSNAGRETASSVTSNTASIINRSGSNTTSNTQNQRDDDVMITATTPREIQRTIGTLGNANRAVSGSQNPIDTNPSNTRRETALSVTSNTASIINRSGSNTTSNTRSQGNDDVIIIASTSRQIQTDIGTLGNANRAVSGSQNPINTNPSNTRRETALSVTGNNASNINSSGSNTTSNTRSQGNDDVMIIASTSREIQRDIGTLGNANRAVSGSQNPINTNPSNTRRETASSIPGNTANNINSSGFNTTSNTRNQSDDDVMITATTSREIQRTIGTLGNANRAVSGTQNPNNTYPTNAGRETASSVTGNTASIINRSESNTTSNTRNQSDDDVMITATTSGEIQRTIGFRNFVAHMSVFTLTHSAFQNLLAQDAVQAQHKRIRIISSSRRRRRRSRDISEPSQRSSPYPTVPSQSQEARGFAHTTPNHDEDSMSAHSSPDRAGRIGNCPVCLTSLADSEIASTFCGHVFCMNCMRTLNTTSKTCPTCRRTLRRNGYHQIYL